jgi:hypothetical protein
VIDEKRLDEMETGARNGFENLTAAQEISDSVALSMQLSVFKERLEFIRLARLGLWAEKHAAPILDEFGPILTRMWADGRLTDANTFMLLDRFKEARKALAALPKEVGE